MRSDPLYEAMKETLRSDKYKKYKVSVSSSRYLYKKDGPYFWSVHFTPQGAPQDGTLPIYLYLSLKYWRFDELQLAVTHPGAAPRFTDRSRCGGGACNAPDRTRDPSLPLGERDAGAGGGTRGAAAPVPEHTQRRVGAGTGAHRCPRKRTMAVWETISSLTRRSIPGWQVLP